MKIEWAFDARGRQPARQVFHGLPAAERSRVMSVLRQFEAEGSIVNRQRFKKLTGELWEFKRFQTRLLGAFRPGERFVISHVLVKKSDLLPRTAVKLAQTALAAHDAFLIEYAKQRAVGTVAAPPPAVAASQLPTPTPPPQEPAPPPPASAKPAPPPPTPLPPEPDYVWTYMRARDVLPPGAPLLLNMCRPSRPERDAANLEVMKLYLQNRMGEMPPEVRMVVNVDDPRLMMGAVLGLEFATAWAEARKPAPAPEPEVTDEPEEAEAETVSEEPAMPAYETVWIGRVKKAPALGVVISRFGTNVTCRQYLMASDTWTQPHTMPARRITGPAKMSEEVHAGSKKKLVSVALTKLEHAAAHGQVKPVWIRRGGDKRAGRTLAVVLSNGGPIAHVTKFAADPRRWTARAKVPCAKIIGPADPAEKVNTTHGILRVADAMALYH
jgi:phage-related protein